MHRKEILSGVTDTDATYGTIEASSEAAARFAARENNADRLNGVDVEDQTDVVREMLVELSQGRTQEQAIRRHNAAGCFVE